MRRKKYRLAIITYIDVLGFKSKIQNSDASSIQGIFNMLRSFKYLSASVFKDKLVDDIKIPVMTRYFSDLIVRITYLDGFNNYYIKRVVSNEMYQLSYMQSINVENSIFVRGAISIGELYYNQGIFFGKAFIESYCNAEEKADNPIIVISPSLLEFLEKQFKPQSSDDKRVTNKISDYNSILPYIDYLSNTLRDTSGNSDVLRKAYMGKHKSIIEKKLVEFLHEDKVFKKYKWLARYHNHTIDRYLKLYPYLKYFYIII